MRERWARLLALFTGVVVLLLAAGFALLQNPTRQPIPKSVPPPVAAAGKTPAPTSPSAPIPPPISAAVSGRKVFKEQGCARCHSIAGQGSPRSPLDDVGSRLSRAEIRQWIVGDDAIKDDLSPRALSAKQGYAALPATQLDALVDYLQGLREE